MFELFKPISPNKYRTIWAIRARIIFIFALQAVIGYLFLFAMNNISGAIKTTEHSLGDCLFFIMVMFFTFLFGVMLFLLTHQIIVFILTFVGLNDEHFQKLIRRMKSETDQFVFHYIEQIKKQKRNLSYYEYNYVINEYPRQIDAQNLKAEKRAAKKAKRLAEEENHKKIMNDFNETFIEIQEKTT